MDTDLAIEHTNMNQIFLDAAVKKSLKTDPLTALQDLKLSLDQEAEERRVTFQQILDSLSGVELSDPQTFKEFKSLFASVCGRLQVRPKMQDGKPASLQVRCKYPTKAYASLAGNGQELSCRVPANTIPHLVVS